MDRTPIIISGGQTGVDRGALDAALEQCWPCGGWCPQGRRAEDGLIDARYPLDELPDGDYAARTRANVRDSDATVILYFDALEGGTALTERYCLQLQRPCLCLDGGFWGPEDAASEIRTFIERNHVRRLNIAGPRASKQPRAQGYSRAVITALLENFPLENFR